MKTKELHKALQKALTKIEEALNFPKTEPMREATIQRFEYTFELSWKLMSSILKDQGNETFGVKNIIRNAARLNLFDKLKTGLNIQTLAIKLHIFIKKKWQKKCMK